MVIRRARPLLGTLLEVETDTGDADKNIIAINGVFEEVSRLEKLLTRFNPDSDVARFNALEVGQSLRVSPETAVLFRLAKFLYKFSQNYFNPSINIIDGSSADFSSIQLQGLQVTKQSEIEVDFGGIGKGFIIDLAIKKLKGFYPRYGLINAGGDIRVFGDKQFPIQIRSGNNAHKLFFSAVLENGAICTSSGYFRGFKKGGKSFQPIFDPHTRNAESAELSISVIAKSAWCADSLTKICALLKDRSAEYIKKMNARAFLQSGDFFREI